MTAARHDYRVLSSAERVRNRVFSIVTDEVEMPGGKAVARDYMVHVGAVGVVALDDADRVALIRQYRHPLGVALWELPAGLVDVPGEALVDGAARELAEEADLTAARWDLLVEIHSSPGSSTEKIRVFLARGLAAVPEGERHTRTDEESEMFVRWVPLDEAVEMALSGEITNSACVAGVLATQAAKARDWATLREASAAT